MDIVVAVAVVVVVVVVVVLPPFPALAIQCPALSPAEFSFGDCNTRCRVISLPLPILLLLSNGTPPALPSDAIRPSGNSSTDGFNVGATPIKLIAADSEPEVGTMPIVCMRRRVTSSG